jgi:hypothetical protein
MESKQSHRACVLRNRAIASASRGAGGAGCRRRVGRIAARFSVQSLEQETRHGRVVRCGAGRLYRGSEQRRRERRERRELAARQTYGAKGRWRVMLWDSHVQKPDLPVFSLV